MEDVVWEYLKCGDKGVEELDKLGEKGWELCGARSYDNHAVLYFKRQKQWKPQ